MKSRIMPQALKQTEIHSGRPTLIDKHVPRKNIEMG